MQDIQNAIAQKIELLRNTYPKIGYQFGFGRNNFKYYIQLDFSAQDLSNDDKFNNFIADISMAIEEKFAAYSFVFFFEKTNLIKTIIETYAPTYETILQFSQKNAYIGIEYSQIETPTIETNFPQTTAKPYAIAA